MTALGELLLLTAFVAAGCAAFAAIAGWATGAPGIRKCATIAATVAVAAVTAASVLLAFALATKDFRFQYVVQYSSRSLPWQYALSAFWVGQAGSLLLWAWMTGAVAVVFRFAPTRHRHELREPAFGVLMGFLCFLLGIVVFAADPMRPSLLPPQEGIGLSPLLQHPAMLIHPPVIFLGYTGWAIPFALALAAVATGRLDDAWLLEARRWALLSWLVLGVGILLGANWAYEELGWGGYWAWDPVENASLLPWLTGTALVHCLMAWQHADACKKTSVLLALVTFGLCNFAAFLTRSGVFSSVHAFSQSRVGWSFLLLMGTVTGGGILLVIWRRSRLAGSPAGSRVWSRESFVVLGTLTLLLLAGAVTVGTLWLPLSELLTGERMVVGPAFYGNALTATGLVMLAVMAAAPLLRWRREPVRARQRVLLGSGALAAVVAGLGARYVAGGPLLLAVAALAAFTVLAFGGSLLLDIRQGWRTGRLSVLAGRRRQYGGFLAHVGCASLALGVTASSLGACREEFTLARGEEVSWGDSTVRLASIDARESPERLVVDGRLEIERGDDRFVLLPAQHYHYLQHEWTTEVAIRSAWSEDFYAVLARGGDDDHVRITLVRNPMVRWIWLSGWIAALGVLLTVWPKWPKAAATRDTESPPLDRSARAFRRAA